MYTHRIKAKKDGFPYIFVGKGSSPGLARAQADHYMSLLKITEANVISRESEENSNQISQE